MIDESKLDNKAVAADKKKLGYLQDFLMGQ